MIRKPLGEASVLNERHFGRGANPDQDSHSREAAFTVSASLVESEGKGESSVQVESKRRNGGGRGQRDEMRARLRDRQGWEVKDRVR